MTPTAMPIAMAIPRDLRMAVLLPKSCKNFAPNFSEGASKLVETADAARRSRLVERRRQDRSGGSRAECACRQPTEDEALVGSMLLRMIAEGRPNACSILDDIVAFHPDVKLLDFGDSKVFQMLRRLFKS